MLRFTKIKKDVITQTEQGDFYGFDASILYNELKPLNARCDTAQVEITVYPIDETLEFDVEAITAVVIAHGSEAQCNKRLNDKLNTELNTPILAQITYFEGKLLRAMWDDEMREEEPKILWSEYYKNQIVELRSLLKTDLNEEQIEILTPRD